MQHPGVPHSLPGRTCAQEGRGQGREGPAGETLSLASSHLTGVAQWTANSEEVTAPHPRPEECGLLARLGPEVGGLAQDAHLLNSATLEGRLYATPFCS